MITTAVISFREFLEAFLIVGVFLGISKKLGLKKELEIGIAAGIGITVSLLLAVTTFSFSKYLLAIFSEKNREILEGSILIFSGIFITYTILSLHNALHKIQIKIANNISQKLKGNTFDISLFFTIIFLVIREGIEIALFTASTSLFSVFIQNFTGLIIGFILASIFGILIFFTYLKFPTEKIFKITESVIFLLGASMMGDGIIKLSDVRNELNLIKSTIMIIYILIVYFLIRLQTRAEKIKKIS